MGLSQPHIPAAETAVIVGEQNMTVETPRWQYLLVRQSPLTATLRRRPCPHKSPWLLNNHHHSSDLSALRSTFCCHHSVRLVSYWFWFCWRHDLSCKCERCCVNASLVCLSQMPCRGTPVWKRDGRSILLHPAPWRERLPLKMPRYQWQTFQMCWLSCTYVCCANWNCTEGGFSH